MRVGFALAAFLSIGLVMTTAPVSAFHGTPFRVQGTACNGTICLPAALDWSGSFGGTGTYRLVVSLPSVPVLGVGLVNVNLGSVNGREVFEQVWFGSDPDWCPASLEFTNYHGYDPLTNGRDFDVRGVQNNCLSNGGRQIDLDGHFRTWVLDLHMGPAL